MIVVSGAVADHLAKIDLPVVVAVGGAAEEVRGPGVAEAARLMEAGTGEEQVVGD